MASSNELHPDDFEKENVPLDNPDLRNYWNFPVQISHQTVGSGAKLKIKNLDVGITVEDLAERFSDCGPLKVAYINKDPKSGKSLGTAHVYFNKESQANEVLKKYNGVEFNKKPMQIHIPVKR